MPHRQFSFGPVARQNTTTSQAQPQRVQSWLNVAPAQTSPPPSAILVQNTISAYELGEGVLKQWLTANFPHLEGQFDLKHKTEQVLYIFYVDRYLTEADLKSIAAARAKANQETTKA